MKRFLIASVVVLVAAIGFVMNISTAKEPPHEVVLKDGEIEVRQYAPQIVAEVTVSGNMRRAGNSGFRPLAGYIFGDNQARQDIKMTAPVTRSAAPTSQEISMTAPVTRVESDSGDWVVAFVMPEEWSMDTLPYPNNPDVRLRKVPSELVATIRFSGTGDEASHREKQQQLEGWMVENNYQAVGPAKFAGYDPPWIPGIFRRNEVIIAVTAAE